mmetsp:Transcript_26217/g.77814  ORF Transcript_26217/g.77814 Transcript_26217/m.77814 type:complete len:287 (+) Transcript_26217:2415-3275(+)
MGAAKRPSGTTRCQPAPRCEAWPLHMRRHTHMHVSISTPVHACTAPYMHAVKRVGLQGCCAIPGGLLDKLCLSKLAIRRGLWLGRWLVCPCSGRGLRLDLRSARLSSRLGLQLDLAWTRLSWCGGLRLDLRLPNLSSRHGLRLTCRPLCLPSRRGLQLKRRASCRASRLGLRLRHPCDPKCAACASCAWRSPSCRRGLRLRRRNASLRRSSRLAGERERGRRRASSLRLLPPPPQSPRSRDRSMLPRRRRLRLADRDRDRDGRRPSPRWTSPPMCPRARPELVYIV